MAGLKTFVARHGFMGRILIVSGVLFCVGLMLFMIQPSLHHRFWFWLALPADVNDFFQRPWTLVTYIFVTPVVPNLLSTIFNLLGFYFLSLLHRNTFGETRNRNFIIHSVILNGLLFVVVNSLLKWPEPLNHLPMYSFRTITMGMLLFAMVYYPNLKVNLYGIIPVPMLAIGALFILVELIQFQQLSQPGPVGMMISLCTGAVYSFLLKRNGTDISSWAGSITGIIRKREKSGLYPSKQHKGKFTVVKSPDDPDQSEIDRILDKISAVGYERLTRGEKETLARYSEKKDSQNEPGGPGKK